MVTHNVKSLERKSRTYASIQTVKEENRTRTVYIRMDYCTGLSKQKDKDYIVLDYCTGLSKQKDKE